MDRRAVVLEQTAVGSTESSVHGCHEESRRDEPRGPFFDSPQYLLHFTNVLGRSAKLAWPIKVQK